MLNEPFARHRVTGENKFPVFQIGKYITNGGPCMINLKLYFSQILDTSHKSQKKTPIHWKTRLFICRKKNRKIVLHKHR